MTIVLDQYGIPEKGEFEVYIKRTVNLRVSAEEARRKVNGWILDQVSYMMGAEQPELVMNEQQVTWRVPIILTACHVGRVGAVGQVDVNVETGEIVHAAECKEKILHYASELSAKLPPYQPRTEMPVGHKTVSLQPSHKPGRPSGNPLDLIPSNARSVAL